MPKRKREIVLSRKNCDFGATNIPWVADLDIALFAFCSLTDLCLFRVCCREALKRLPSNNARIWMPHKPESVESLFECSWHYASSLSKPQLEFVVNTFHADLAKDIEWLLLSLAHQENFGALHYCWELLQYHFDVSEISKIQFLDIACSHGNLELVQWGVHVFDFSYWQAFAGINTACTHGHLHIVQWFYARFAPNAPLFHLVFQHACLHGHRNIALWATTQFRISAQTIRRDNLFQQCCWRGQLEIVKWFVARFDIGLRDLGDFNEGFAAICRNGQLQVLKWIIDKFQISKTYASQCEFAAFRGACANGQLEVAQFLACRFKMTKHEVASSHALVFVMLNPRNKRRKMDQWLLANSYL